MFEQSILANETAAHKTRALAASFGLQTLVIGVALLIPLLFADRLPRVPLWTSLSVPAPAPPERPPVQATTSQQATPSVLRSTPRVFTLSNNTHPTAAIDATIITEAGPSTESVGSIGVIGGVLGTALPPMIAVAPAPVHVALAAVKAPDKPLRLGGEVQAAKLIRRIVPEYPPIAIRTRVSGTVRLTGVIAKDGTIEQLQVISGNPMLVPAALAAVKQWIYSPTFLNGQPVEVIAPIDVIFTLAQ